MGRSVNGPGLITEKNEVIRKFPLVPKLDLGNRRVRRRSAGAVDGKLGSLFRKLTVKSQQGPTIDRRPTDDLDPVAVLHEAILDLSDVQTLRVAAEFPLSYRFSRTSQIMTHCRTSHCSRLSPSIGCRTLVRACERAEVAPAKEREGNLATHSGHIDRAVSSRLMRRAPESK